MNNKIHSITKMYCKSTEPETHPTELMYVRWHLCCRVGHAQLCFFFPAYILIPGFLPLRFLASTYCFQNMLS